MKHVLMPFAKKMKVMEKCLSQSDSKQRDEKKMLIFDIGFFCVLLFKRLKVGLFDVFRMDRGRQQRMRSKYHISHPFEYNRKERKPIEPKDQINNCNMILHGRPPQPTLRYFFQKN